MGRTVIIIMLVLGLGACSTFDTPYDPDFPREKLFDQIPNSEGEAVWRCGGHLPPEERQPHQTGRC